MNGSRTRLVPLVLAGALATAIAGASVGGASISRVGCAAAAAPGAGSVAYQSPLRTYDDYIEDVRTAPDICGSNLVTNDNEVITVGLHIHDRDGFAAGDGYALYLDTDRNSTTGSPAAPGQPAGAEYVVQVLDESSNLRRWNGSAYEPVTLQTSIDTVWFEDYGPALFVDPADLGNPQGFDVVFVTTNADDHDFAPDTGSWSYELSPLELKAGRLTHSPAVAGKPFVAAMPVLRSDFDDTLDDGTIACAAKLGHKSLAGRGAFRDDRVVCAWRLPKNARGKRLAGTAQVTFEGVVARRAFSVRVR